MNIANMFPQTNTWGLLNQHYNNLEPVIVTMPQISCLFGLDYKKSLISFNGPEIISSATEHDFKNFLNEVLVIADLNKVSQIRFNSLPPLRCWPEHIEETLLSAGYIRQEWKTFIIDLGVTEDDLFRCFDHAARKNIKKALAYNIKIESCSDFTQYYRDFIIPYCDATKRELKSQDFYRYGWDLDVDNIYRYWIAKSSEGDILGLLGTYRFNSIATEISSALTKLAYEQKIPAQDLLHWEIIKHHKQLGDSYLDLAGFSPNPNSLKEQNIRRFKEKWGGSEYDCSSYYLDLRSNWKKSLNRFKRILNV